MLIPLSSCEQEPLSLADTKLHLRVDHDDEDTLISVLIQVARQQAEHRTGRVLLHSQLQCVLDGFSPLLELTCLPVQAVQSIYWRDGKEVWHTLDTDAYRVYLDGLPALIAPHKPWPQAVGMQSVKIDLIAGYASPAQVPAPLRQWMLLTIGALYTQREGLAGGGLASPAQYQIPRAFYGGLLDPYLIPRV